jgi:hypothetical protein
MTRKVGTLYVLGIAALTASVGCGASPNTSASAPAAPVSTPLQTAASTQPNGSPVIVSCEPHQRTLVRPVVVNGATLSQIECVTNTGVTLAAQPQPIAVPAYAPAPVYQPVRVAQTVPVSDDYGDTRVIAPQRTTSVVRPVQREVVYREPIRKQRSVKKSAVIIGSSAGVGAGVGAAVGGKKGALLGALIGGGGATVWDQITRRK